MPLFYFDISTDGVLTRDVRGQELPDRDAAQREAAEALESIIRDTPRPDRSYSIMVVVRDSDDKPFLLAKMIREIERLDQFPDRQFGRP